MDNKNVKTDVCGGFSSGSAAAAATLLESPVLRCPPFWTWTEPWSPSCCLSSAAIGSEQNVRRRPGFPPRPGFPELTLKKGSRLLSLKTRFSSTKGGSAPRLSLQELRLFSRESCRQTGSEPRHAHRTSSESGSSHGQPGSACPPPLGLHPPASSSAPPAARCACRSSSEPWDKQTPGAEESHLKAAEPGQHQKKHLPETQQMMMSSSAN